MTKRNPPHGARLDLVAERNGQLVLGTTADERGLLRCASCGAPVREIMGRLVGCEHVLRLAA